MCIRDSDIDAVFKHEVGDVDRFLRIVDHDRHDRVFTGNQVQADCRHLLSEIVGVVFHFVDETRVGFEHRKHFQRRTADRRRQRVRKQIRTALLSQPIDDILACGGETARRTAERFAEGRGQNIDLPHHAAEFVLSLIHI